MPGTSLPGLHPRHAGYLFSFDPRTPLANSATKFVTALTVFAVALPFLSRLCATALTSAEPTTTASAPPAISRPAEIPCRRTDCVEGPDGASA